MDGIRKKAGTLHPVILSLDRSRQQPAGRQRVKALSLIARQAVKLSSQISALPLDVLKKNSAGAPQPSRGIYWSLAHKTEKVAGVVAAGPVGIDIEKIRTVHGGLFKRIADNSEWEIVGGKNTEALFRIWTAKEAVLKAEGRGLAGLALCRLTGVSGKTDLVLEYGGRHWTVVQRWIADGFIAALTIDSGQQVKWHIETIN